jgi:hypothetical protein
MLIDKKRTVALSLALSAVLGVVVHADDTEFAARQNEAKQAILSGAGKDYYYGPFSKALAGGFDKRIRQLIKCSDDRDTADTFDMLLKLTGDGHVETAMARPESKIAACYLKQAQKDRFPVPPSAGFWVEVAIRFGRREAVEVPLASNASMLHRAKTATTLSGWPAASFHLPRQGDRRPFNAPTTLPHRVAFPCPSAAFGHLRLRPGHPQARLLVSPF